MDNITYPITKLSIPQTPDSSVISAKDLEWMHYTSTPSQPFRVIFRSSSSSGNGRLERMKVKLDVMGGEAVYATLELSEYARSWNSLPTQPLGYKMKDKCVLIKYTSPLQPHRGSGTGHRFQLRFSTLTDTQSFVATLIQHCPPLVASDIASRVSGGGVLKSATINTPSAVGGRPYGMDYGNGMGTTGNWENETQTTIPSSQHSYDVDGFRVPKRPLIQPLRLPPREYDPNVPSARLRYAPPSPSFDRDLGERSKRGMSLEGRAGTGTGGPARNEFVDLGLSQEPFADDTQTQSQTQPTGYTQQMMPLPIPYHPSPLRFVGESSIRKGEWGAGTQTQSSQRMSPDVFGGGTSRYASPLRNKQESSMTGLGIQPRKLSRLDLDSEVRYSIAPVTNRIWESNQTSENSQRMQTLPSMRVGQPEACPSGRPTLVSMQTHQPDGQNPKEPDATQDAMAVVPLEMKKDVITTSVRVASQLYDLPEEEIEGLVAEILREDGFEGFVGKVSKMSWRALAVIGSGRKDDAT